MAFYIDHVPRGRDLLDRLLAAPSLAEQVALYETELRPRLLGEGLLRAAGSPAVLALLGVPGPQRQMVMNARGGVKGFLSRSFSLFRQLEVVNDQHVLRRTPDKFLQLLYT